MRHSLKHLRASVKWIGAALIAGSVTLGAAPAFAQNNCARIESQLRAIEGSREFRSLGSASAQAGQLENQVRQAETAFIGAGCQQQMATGRLDSQCQTIARAITSGRSQLQQAQQLAMDGQSLAQQREQLLAQASQCASGGSGVTFQDQRGDQQLQARRSLFDQIFSGDGGQRRAPGFGDYVEEPYADPWSRQATRRTVCVRTCDGYFWPISFSTVESYFGSDANQCAQQCPGADVQLFSYRNPGEDPEQMVSISGEPYRSMPYAFRYRQSYDNSCSCRALSTARGSITTLPAQSAAVIDFETVDVPLPRTDPRGRIVAATVLDAVHVPLPRRRPSRDGADAEPEVVRVRDLRLVNFGERTVRVVGPETPFAPEEAG